MERELSALTLIGLFLGALLIPPLWATDRERVHIARYLIPETDRPHVAETVLAIPVFHSLTVVWCDLEYIHSRVRYDLGPPYEVVNLDLSKGGQTRVRFEIVTKTETTLVDERSTKVKNLNLGWRQALMFWGDSSGMDSVDNYKPVAAFPMQLESGDVLLFSTQFRRMPRLLGVERTDTDLRRDSIFMAATCGTCGTNSTPCPEAVEDHP